MTHLRTERLWGGTLFALGLAYGLYTLRYPIGTVSRPGPGSFPLLLAVGLVLVGLGLAFSGSDPIPSKGGGGGTGALWPAGVMAAVLLGYAWLMPVLGPVLTTAVALFILTKLFGLRGWAVPALLSAACALGITLLFLRFLRIPLPEGLGLIERWLR